MMSKETGGFVFPSKVPNLTEDIQNIYGYEVPPGGSFTAGGMTLRDHFAGLALNGDASHKPFHHEATDEQIAHYASLYYRIADAMLKAREK